MADLTDDERAALWRAFCDDPDLPWLPRRPDDEHWTAAVDRMLAVLDPPGRAARAGAAAVAPYEHAITWGVPTVTEAQELDRLIGERHTGYLEGKRRAVELLVAEADDEARRPTRDCCSHAIETWLRDSAQLVERDDPL